MLKKRITVWTALVCAAMLLAGAAAAAPVYAVSDDVTGKGWEPPKKKKVWMKIVSVKKGGKKKGDKFELRKGARQALYKYDTLQGACADDGYGYYTLFNRKKDKCRLVKVRLKDMKVIKVSRALAVNHGNSLTYDSKRGRLVVCHGDKGTWKITLVDPKKLKVIGTRKIRIGKSVPGMPKKVRRQFNGITAIAYNAKRDVYVARIKDEHNLVILTSKFKVKRYMKACGKSDMLFQGMDSYGDYIFDCQSFDKKHKYNLITIRNWKGKVVSRVKIRRKAGLELEEVYHDGPVFYAGFYYTTNQYHDDKKYRVKRYGYLYRIPKL